MKRILLTIILVFWAVALHAQPQSVSIKAGHKAPVLQADVNGKFDVSGSNPMFHFRGNSGTAGDFKMDADGHYFSAWPITVHENASPNANANPKHILKFWEHIDFKETVTGRGVKHEYWLLNDQAQSDIVWKFITSVHPDSVFMSGDSVHIGETFMLAPAWALDADTVEVPVVRTLTGPVAGVYTLTDFVAYAGSAWPVWVDPSVTITIGSGVSGSTRGLADGTYLTARNSATASTVGLDESIFGQSTAFQVRRTIIPFDISGITAGATIDSAKLVLFWLSDALLSADFDIVTRLGDVDVNQPPLVADHSKFDGHTPTGTYGGTPPTDTVNTSDYVINESLTFQFTSAGLDSISTRFLSGDSLFIFLLSDDDINAVEPSVDQRITLSSGDDAGKEPELTVYFRTSSLDSLTALNDSTVRAVIDTAGKGTSLGFDPDTLVYSFISGTDTVKSGDRYPLSLGLIDTFTVPDSDTLLSVFPFYIEAGGDSSFGTLGASVQMPAAAPTVTNIPWTQTVIGFLPSQGRNQLQTKYAFQCSASTLLGDSVFWITNAFDTSGSDTSWQSLVDWGIDTSFVLPDIFVVGDTITIWSFAHDRSADSTVTDRGAAGVDTLFGTISLTASPIDSTRLIYAITTGVAPSWVTTSNGFLAGTLAHKDSAFSDTTAHTPGQTRTDTTDAGGRVLPIATNTRYAPVAAIILNNHDSTAVSSIDSIFTDPNVAGFSLTTTVTSETSFVAFPVITFNPDYTLFGFIDSLLVKAGSTFVWYGEGALSTTAVYFTEGYFSGTTNDTLTFIRNTGALAGDSTDVYLVATSGDSLALGLK